MPVDLLSGQTTHGIPVAVPAVPHRVSTSSLTFICLYLINILRSRVFIWALAFCLRTSSTSHADVAHAPSARIHPSSSCTHHIRRHIHTFRSHRPRSHNAFSDPLSHVIPACNRSTYTVHLSSRPPLTQVPMAGRGGSLRAALHDWSVETSELERERDHDPGRALRRPYDLAHSCDARRVGIAGSRQSRTTKGHKSVREAVYADGRRLGRGCKTR